MPETEPPFEREQEDAAAAEAAAIGGRVSNQPQPVQDETPDPADRPLAEAGEGESEGFELAEQELVEHASHGDQHAARQVMADAFDEPDDARAAAGGEPDTEQEPDA